MEVEAVVPKFSVEELAELEQFVRKVRDEKERGRKQSVLVFQPVSVGKILKPFSRDDDLMGEMLEGRRL